MLTARTDQSEIDETNLLVELVAEQLSLPLVLIARDAAADVPDVGEHCSLAFCCIDLPLAFLLHVDAFDSFECALLEC